MNIEFVNVTKKFDKYKVLKNFSYTFEDKKTSFIMGSSGVGKTTLVRIIMGLENDYYGEVKGLEGRKMSAVFQDDSLCQNLSVFLNIKLVSDLISKEKLIRDLSELGLDDILDKRVRELSGGMKRRVAILRALSVEFDTLIMDEPFKGLDSENKEKVMNMIIEKTFDKTVIIVSHNIEEYIYFKKYRNIEILNMKNSV